MISDQEMYCPGLEPAIGLGDQDQPVEVPAGGEDHGDAQAGDDDELLGVIERPEDEEMVGNRRVCLHSSRGTRRRGVPGQAVPPLLPV